MNMINFTVGGGAWEAKALQVCDVTHKQTDECGFVWGIPLPLHVHMCVSTMS